LFSGFISPPHIQHLFSLRTLVLSSARQAASSGPNIQPPLRLVYLPRFHAKTMIEFVLRTIPMGHVEKAAHRDQEGSIEWSTRIMDTKTSAQSHWRHQLCDDWRSWSFMTRRSLGIIWRWRPSHWCQDRYMVATSIYIYFKKNLMHLGLLHGSHPWKLLNTSHHAMELFITSCIIGERSL